MKYKEIHVALSDHPERLNRTIIVKEKTPLIELGIILGASLKVEFNHYFLFHKGKKMYEAQSWTEQFNNKNAYSMMNYTIEDLGDEFIYEYDTGDGWEFDCKVLDLEGIDIGNERVLINEATGAGIFEDGHYVLDEYLNGNIDPEMNDDDEEEGIFLPENLNLERISDFDKEIDIVRHNIEVNDEIRVYLNSVSEDYRRSEQFIDSDFMEEDDDALNECRSDLAYCYDRLGELMDGLHNLNESLSNKYGKEKAKEVLKAVVMNHLVDLLEEED